MWRAKTDQEQLLPPQDQLFRRVGLGESKLRIVYGALISLALLNVGQFVERQYLVATLREKVYVVVTDPSGAIAKAAQATADWKPGDGAWLFAAREWIRNVRAKPPDQSAWKAQLGKIRATTDRQVFAGLSEWLQKTSEEYRDKPIEVEILSSSLLRETVTDHSATANVVWKERRLGIHGPGNWAAQCSVLITLAKKAPEDLPLIETLQEANQDARLLGIYVIGYSPHCGEAPEEPLDQQQKAEAR
jgi:type IV secretory pathway TrbF-like protein